jgi:hypothetical protein
MYDIAIIEGELGGERGGLPSGSSRHQPPGSLHADLYGAGAAAPTPHLLHPGLYDVMHPAGPLAMVSPLHPFDTSRYSLQSGLSLFNFCTPAYWTTVNFS